MAKIRGLKPEFWTDENVCELSPFARLLFIGMWNYACDNGHLQDKPKQIKRRILPDDDVSCAELLCEIAAQGLIQRADGWVTIPNLTQHQKVDRRYFTTCDHPGCEEPEETVSQRESRRAHGGHTSSARRANAGRTAGALGDGDGDGDGDVSGSAPRAVTSSSGNASRKRPAKPLPDDWQPTDTHRTRCVEERIDIDRAVEKFRAHAEANDRRQVNWNAAFTQWLLNEKPGAPKAPPRRYPRPEELERPPDGLSDEEMSDWLHEQVARRRRA